MSWGEWSATLLGVACVALAAARSVWTFPTAIGSVVLLGWVVFAARLYSDAVLQAFFVAANIYGWVSWQRARAVTGNVRVGYLTMYGRAAWGAAIVVIAIGWGAAMHRWTDAAYPWWDAAIAAASIAAQLLMARRRIEHWWLWIAIDVASVPLYLAKSLFLFAGLYLLYLIISIWGLVGWKRAAA